jgi:serine/threonine-protein kinase
MIGPQAKSTSDQASADSIHEQRLADVLAEMRDRAGRGETVDLESYCQQHSDLAADLRDLWRIGVFADRGIPSSDLTASAVGSLAAASSGLSPLAAATPQRVGDYRLISELGRGGMGVVYLARDERLKREVAIKMISRGRMHSPSDLQRFASEAAAAARLQHAAIVPVYEVGEWDGRPYFSMRFIRGETLADRLRRGPLPQREAAHLIAKVARAVGYAHLQGVLHRDLKPSNILLDRAGEPHVTDFGLAKLIEEDMSLTATGAVLGTPSYMSPEQAAARDDAVGPRSDVYSLGCVLYHALTGRPPLVADTPVELVLKVLEQDPPSPRELRPSIDHDLNLIVVRCLQKPPDLRYASALAFADDLEAYLRDETVSATSGRMGQVVARWLRDTHHAPILENWGLLWMWHSLALLVVSLLTWILEWNEVASRPTYALLWTLGLGAWAAVFWRLRQRSGPVTFIERQIAHVWAASMMAIGLLFPLEAWLGLPPLALSPLLGVITAMVFLIKAGMLSGAFYTQVVVMLLTSVVMAWQPRYAHLVYGILAAACFFFPGLKYYRQRRRQLDGKPLA